MSFGQFIDWLEEWEKSGKWENIGRRALEEACVHGTKQGEETNVKRAGYCEDCKVSEHSAEPMMNFIYPLACTPTDERVLLAVQQTSCTVMYNVETDEYFLSLCGGGMDLSQDIAMAYHILEQWIPFELCIAVATQPGLSVDGPNYQVMAEAVVASLKKCICMANDKLKAFRHEGVSADKTAEER